VEHQNKSPRIIKCKNSPAPDSVEAEQIYFEKVNIKKVAINKYFKLKTNCDIDGFFVITEFDGNYNIKKCNVALMPKLFK
jgi:hypothetical protein